MHTPHVLSGGRYPVLRSLAIIYVIAAGLAVLSTLLGVAYILFGTRFAWSDRAIMSVGAFTAGFFLVLSMLAIAEVLKLVIDIEHNTRMSAHRGGGAGSMPSTIAITTSDAATTVVAAEGDGAGAAMAAAGGDGASRTANRLDALDEETAEAALLRGH
jgi:hypothetical protein